MTVLSFHKKPSLARLECSACGAAADAACNCGAPYLPAGTRAAEAVAANPEKSDRLIAQELGNVSRETVRKARKVTTKLSPEKRTGRDGKYYPAKRSRKNSGTLTAAQMVAEYDLPSLEDARRIIDAAETDKKNGNSAEFDKLMAPLMAVIDKINAEHRDIDVAKLPPPKGRPTEAQIRYAAKHGVLDVDDVRYTKVRAEFAKHVHRLSDLCKHYPPELFAYGSGNIALWDVIEFLSAISKYNADHANDPDERESGL